MAQLLQGREVPLGGVRALTVRRTLPHRDRSFVGAWCFVDHYGPARSAMDVPPHPHTGLQTVSWLFEGEIEHRDAGGAVATVRPGEVNLMTAGFGISHSEVSTPQTEVLHGVQLWVALPERYRHTARRFESHRIEPLPLPDDSGEARVFLGSLIEVTTSPVRTYTPLVGAQIDLKPGVTTTLYLDRSFEHGILLDTGALTVGDTTMSPADLLCFDPGPDEVRVQAGPAGARLLLLGGEPFAEEIVMWWNFVGRSHDEIVQLREQWMAQADRFGTVEGYAGETTWLPAPELPRGVKLRPRNRRGRIGG